MTRDLALALLKSLARERVDDFVGFGKPAFATPSHAAAATELEQTIRSLHVPPPTFRASPARTARGCASGAPVPARAVVSPKRASHGPCSVGPMLSVMLGTEEVARRRCDLENARPSAAAREELETHRVECLRFLPQVGVAGI